MSAGTPAAVAARRSEHSPTSGIAEAVASLPPAGGVVHVPAGAYPLRATVHLPSGVRLVGDGVATVLRVAPIQRVALAADVDVAARVVELAGDHSFRPGDAIGLTDQTNAGWWGTHATVSHVEGTTLRMDGEVTRALSTELDARAVNLFPAVQANDATDVEVTDLSIQGPEGYAGAWWDFTYSAVHIVGCQRSRVRNLNVSNWPSDGISIQRGSDAQVTACQAHGNTGHGFHPGTGLGQSIWSHNIAKGNGRDGLFFCMGVHHTVCSDNVFTENGRHGIGGVAEGGDHHDIISDNVCSYNAQCGIDASRGEEQVITGNLLLGNSRESPGKWPGVRLHDIQRALVQGNRCADDQETPTQTAGIVESGDSDGNLISGNLCTGMQTSVRLVGPGSQEHANLA